MDVNVKYLKDETGNVISPVVSTKSLYNRYNENIDEYTNGYRKYAGKIINSVNSRILLPFRKF